MSEWPDDLAATIHKLYMIDGLSGSEVSRKLGGSPSRVAIIAGAGRRGWVKPAHTARARTEQTRRPAPAYAAEAGAKLIYELDRHCCSWPVGPEPERPAKQLYCGRAKASTAMYCDDHRAKALKKGSPPCAS